MDESPFGFVDAEAGSVSYSQKQILRHSRFIRNTCPSSVRKYPASSVSSSSSSSDEGESDPAVARYRICVRPVTIRSASDSHHSLSSSSTSSDARGGDAGEVARRRDNRLQRRAVVPEEHPDVGGDGGGPVLPSNEGYRLLVGRGGKQSRASKRKHSSKEEEEEGAERKGKKLRPLSDESTQEPEDSPVSSPRGKLVARRLEFRETEEADGTPQTTCSFAEAEGGDRSARAEIAKFRYVRTGTPPLSYSPPELLKGSPGCPKRACGVALGFPHGASPVAQDPADAEVIKSVTTSESPRDVGKRVMGLHRPSPSIQAPADREKDDGSGTLAGSRGSLPLDVCPDAMIQLQNPVQPEVERTLGTGLGTSSPVEILEQEEGQRAAEGGPSGGSQSSSPPTMGVTEGETMEIKRPSDLVDLLIQLSKKPDKGLENVDFLEVFAMKGIHIPPPRWWRPGGYSRPK